MNRSRRLLAAAVAVVALVGVVTLASAASLPVGSATLTSDAVGHPCSGTAAVTAATGSGVTYSAVSVTLPAGCANRYVTLRMTNGTTTLTGTGQVTASNVAVVSFVPPTTYNATSAWTILATVDGWNLPTTWSFTAPAYWCTVIPTGSTATCAATVTRGTRSPLGEPIDFYHVVVTTPSTSWVTWEVTFNLAHPFYGAVPTRLGNADLDPYSAGGTDVNWAYNTANVNDVQRSSPCSVLPGELRVTGLTSGTIPNVFRDVKNDRTRGFDLLVNVTSPAGYDDVIAPNCV